MRHDQAQEHEFGLFCTMSEIKNYFKKEKYETEYDSETFKFLNFDEIFYCGMTRLRNKILNYCGSYQYVRYQHCC